MLLEYRAAYKEPTVMKNVQFQKISIPPSPRPPRRALLLYTPYPPGISIPNWTTAHASSLPLDNKYLVATWWLYCLFPSLRNTLARPKSAIFRCPVELISKLAGFKSFRKERIAMIYIFFKKRYRLYHEFGIHALSSVYCLEFGERGYIYLAPT